MTSNFAAVVTSAVEGMTSQTLARFGDAWAQATADAAPVDTEALRKSVRYVPTGPYSGELRMLAYARPVATGHRVARWGTSSRKRTYKTGGFVPANPFLQRAVPRIAASISPDLLARMRAIALAAIEADLTS